MGGRSFDCGWRKRQPTLRMTGWVSGMGCRSFDCGVCDAFAQDDRFVKGENRATAKANVGCFVLSEALREEGFYVFDGLGDAVGGQGVEEDAAVALALDARVEQHEHTAVLQRAD